jgi:hypothetical protein
MLEVARRQGLVTSSFQNGPNGEKTRLYHSWDYQPPTIEFNEPKQEEEDPDSIF